MPSQAYCLRIGKTVQDGPNFKEMLHVKSFVKQSYEKLTKFSGYQFFLLDFTLDFSKEYLAEYFLLKPISSRVLFISEIDKESKL